MNLMKETRSCSLVQVEGRQAVKKSVNKYTMDSLVMSSIQRAKQPSSSSYTLVRSRGAPRVGPPSLSRDLKMPEGGSPTDICRKCDPGRRIASAKALG